MGKTTTRKYYTKRKKIQVNIFKLMVQKLYQNYIKLPKMLL